MAKGKNAPATVQKKAPSKPAKSAPAKVTPKAKKGGSMKKGYC